MSLKSSDPPLDCARCPRLKAFRDDWKSKESGWYNAPVPSFGPKSARLLILGLAPGLRGANATGRPFTGDYAGDLLYEMLGEFGFATGDYAKHAGDGLSLVDCRISNAVRCVPPQNKPVGSEVNACRPFLQSTIDEMNNLKTVLALGRIAHDTFLRFAGLRVAKFRFEHAASHRLLSAESRELVLFDSYHCSRYNTNTGRLTKEMFREVFQLIRRFLDASE